MRWLAIKAVGEGLRQSVAAKTYGVSLCGSEQVGAIGKVGRLRVLKSKRQFVDLRPIVGDNAFEAGIKTAQNKPDRSCAT